MLILVTALAGKKEASEVAVIEKIKISAIDKGLISLGITSRR